MNGPPDSVLQILDRGKLFVAARRGFTLIEVLLVVAVLAIIGGIGVTVVNNISDGTRVSKLENDVAVINSAVQVFQVSGGALPATPTVNNILAELKKTATSASGSKVAGFRGGTIDPRLVAEFQTVAEASSGQTRARWDSTTSQFVLATSGAAGVKRFLLSDAQGEVDPGTAARGTNNPLATTDSWVWEFDDATPTTPSGPSLPSTGAGSNAPPPSVPGTTQLSPPTFDPGGGLHSVFDFPLAVSISDPNPPGVSRIVQQPATLHDGDDVSVAVGESLTNYYAQSIDPTRYTDSGVVSATYSAVPHKLEIELSLPESSMTYQEAGGTMFVNNTAQPTVVPERGIARVASGNLTNVPEPFRDPSRFQVVWTTDGTNPLTSATAQSASSATGGQEVELPFAAWTNDGLTVRAAAKAVDTTYFESSEVSSSTISIDRTTLHQPLIDPPTTSRTADLPVNIYQWLGQAYPASSRIYYATGGTDPGVSGSEPVAGTLFTEFFQVGTTDGSGVVKARIYPPTAQAIWFDPSPVTTAVYTNGGGGTGAVVQDASVNGTYIGSLIITSTKNFNLNSGAIIAAGNLFVRGTPEVETSNGGVIEGRQFLSDGTEVVPASDTRKVIDLNGDPNPSNYRIRLNSGSRIEGKIYRRISIEEPPSVAAPPGPNNNRNNNVNSQPSAPLNANDAANINLNNGAGRVELRPGNWGNINTGSGTTLVIGNVGDTTPTVYNFQRMNVNSNSTLEVVGPVILTLDNGINLSSAVMGNVDHPEWLNLRIHSGNFAINSNATAYTDLNAPESNVNLNGTFRGSVIAKTLSVNGNGVAITQAIITDPNSEDQ